MNEWTVERMSTRNVWKLMSGKRLITTSVNYSMMQLIADAHNAALSTVKEQQRKADWDELAKLENALAAANSQLDEAGSHNAAADRELRELRQQLAKLKEGK